MVSVVAWAYPCSVSGAATAHEIGTSGSVVVTTPKTSTDPGGQRALTISMMTFTYRDWLGYESIARHIHRSVDSVAEGIADVGPTSGKCKSFGKTLKALHCLYAFAALPFRKSIGGDPYGVVVEASLDGTGSISCTVHIGRVHVRDTYTMPRLTHAGESSSGTAHCLAVQNSS